MDKCIFFLLLCIPIVLSSCSGYKSTIVTKAALNEQFTDNLRLSNSNPQSEVISLLSPGILYGLKGKNDELNLSYDPAFVYNAAGESDFTTRQSAKLDMMDQISKEAKVSFGDKLLYTNEPTPAKELTFSRVDLQTPEDTTLRKNVKEYFVNDANIRYSYDLGPHDSLRLGYIHHILDNVDPTIEDSTSNQPSMAFTHWLNSQYGIEANAAYIRGDFSQQTESFDESISTLRFLQRFSRQFDTFVQYTNTSMNFEGDLQNYQVHEGSLGIDYHISDTTFCTLKSGYYYKDSGQSKAITGYVLSGDMAKKIQHGSIRLSGGTGYRETFFGAENLGFTKYYEGALSGRYAFTKRLNGELSQSYTNNTYTDIKDREDQVMTTTASIAYLLRSWLSLSLSFAHRDFDSTTETNSYSENRITLGISMTQPHPFRFEH